MGALEDLRQARESFERREWVSAFEELSRLDDDDLGAAEFDALATTAYLLGRHNDCVQALQRAHRSHTADGAVLAAVRDAFWLGIVLVEGGEPAVARGWVLRGTRQLEDQGDVVERGYLLVHEMLGHVAAGAFEDALRTAVEITAYGQRFNDPDLLAFGLNAEGRGLTMAGRVREGLDRLDEAMVGLVAGEVSPIFSGMIYCSMIEACQWVGDLGRVEQWTRALTTWCDQQPGIVAFTGQCAVHRGQLMRLHGAWADALAELEQAAERYTLTGAGPAVGLVHRERGDVLQLLGDLDGAARAYAEAAPYGEDGQPGRALLALASGDTESAAVAARQVLRDRRDPVSRSQVLGGLAEVLVAVGDLEGASGAATELDGLARTFGCDALCAIADVAQARVALATGDATTALERAHAGATGWSALSAPYETARCQVLAGRALAARGDEAGAREIWRTAEATLTRLGAAAAADVRALLGQDEPPAGLSVRELGVLRLVAAGRSNAEIAEALVISDKTVARHLSNIFVKLDVGSRTAAAAFAYQHRLLSQGPPASR